MSGGVDSSVAAYLTQQLGYDCTGITLKLFDNDDISVKEKACCSLDDIEDARSVCRKLAIPYYVYNFKDSFRENVISRFIHAYETGATPNTQLPDQQAGLGRGLGKVKGGRGRMGGGMPGGRGGRGGRGGGMPMGGPMMGGGRPMM